MASYWIFNILSRTQEKQTCTVRHCTPETLLTAKIIPKSGLQPWSKHKHGRPTTGQKGDIHLTSDQKTCSTTMAWASQYINCRSVSVTHSSEKKEKKTENEQQYKYAVTVGSWGWFLH